MTDLSRSIAVKPIIKYPHEAQIGKTYLMTIDLQPEEEFEWQYEEEEYPIYCKVYSELFTSKPVGEPVIVLHRFGGSYGASNFLLTAVLEEIYGSIQIDLVNRWGVTTKVINLEQVKVVNEEIEDLANPISTFSSSKAIKQETDIRKQSRKLLLTDWVKANDALNQYFEGNKSKLAAHVKISRTTVTAFFKLEPVREAEFRKLCLTLRLNWQEVSAVQPIPAESFSDSRVGEQETDARKRSRSLVLTNWTKANDALNIYFEGNKSKLSEHVMMSRTTVRNFLNEKPVREMEFRKLCLALRLNWREVSQIEAIVSLPDDLLQQIREHCRQKILSMHNRMRLLSGEEIGVDQLYVDVWLLNRSPRTFQVSQSKLLQTFDLRNDRLGLGDRIKRNSGFEVANVNTKLLILGKPGAGKTTFLKHLAVDWCKGQFQSDMIAVFIELRRIRDVEWKLLDAIREELGLENPQQIEALLHQGKLLVLLDGLDQVPTNALRRDVQSQLQQIADKYANNRWILTSRTQIIESIPHGFTSVEVADFSLEQVQQFVRNWFKTSGHSDAVASQQWERFDNAVSRNSALRELIFTPVLLSLMCLVFQDEGEIPAPMTGLYQKGIALLLSRWNDGKAIEGWEVGSDTYRKLSVEQKEVLLSAIAARKFENPENFVLFQQNEIVAQIAQFLHLTNLKEGVAVLKAIEAQHGLLVERADELWSFSHLTFQEYFTVQWLTQLTPEQLAEKIADRQWQQIVEQLVRAQQPVDRLIRLIKYAIDRLIANEPVINDFLAQRTEQMRQQIMIENQDITHDLQLIDSQIQLFQRYYNANKFLVGLMKIEGRVSNSIRVEIENTLLLPWNELQRRQPDIYGSHN